MRVKCHLRFPVYLISFRLYQAREYGQTEARVDKRALSIVKNVGTIFRTARLYQWDIHRWKYFTEEQIDFENLESRHFVKMCAWNVINKRTVRLSYSKIPTIKIVSLRK